jgi:hypothetical protein
MPIYEYQGQQYDIATEDHAEAKAKILSYLDKQSAPTEPKSAPAKTAPKATPETESTGDAMGGDLGAAIMAEASPKKGKSIFENGTKMEPPTVDYEKNLETMRRSGSPDSVMFNPGRQLEAVDTQIARGKVRQEAATQKEAEKAAQERATLEQRDEAEGYSPLDLAKDTGIGLVGKGGTGLAQSVAGLGSLATGWIPGDEKINPLQLGQWGNMLDKLDKQFGVSFEKGNKFLTGLQSPRAQLQLGNVEKADGFFNTIKELGVNPLALIDTVASSIPSIVASGKVGGEVLRLWVSKATTEAVAKGLTGKAAEEYIRNRALTAATLAAHAAEGTLSAGSIAEEARAQGMEWEDYVAPAVAAGVGTALIGYGAGKAGAKLGIGDIETSLAARTAGVKGMGVTEGPALSGFLKEITKEGFFEEMPQSAQEQIFTNVATGRPWDEGVDKASAQGLMAGLATAGGHNAVMTALKKNSVEAAPMGSPTTSEQTRIEPTFGLEEQLASTKKPPTQPTPSAEGAPDVGQPIDKTGGVSPDVVGQPDQVAPAGGVEEPTADGVVPAGEDVGSVTEGAGAQPQALTFTTAKGSVYVVGEDGKTSRTKNSEGRGQGTTYEPHMAMYVQPGDHENILNDMRSGLGGNSVRLGYIDNNKFYYVEDVADIPEGAQSFVGVFNKKKGTPIGLYPALTTPEIGFHPVEKLYTPDGMSNTHIGNAIVDIQPVAPTGEQAAPTQEETAQASVSPVVSTTTINVGGKKSVKVKRRDGSVEVDGVQTVPPKGQPKPTKQGAPVGTQTTQAVQAATQGQEAPAAPAEVAEEEAKDKRTLKQKQAAVEQMGEALARTHDAETILEEASALQRLRNLDVMPLLEEVADGLDYAQRAAFVVVPPTSVLADVGGVHIPELKNTWRLYQQMEGMTREMMHEGAMLLDKLVSLVPTPESQKRMGDAVLLATGSQIDPRVDRSVKELNEVYDALTPDEKEAFDLVFAHYDSDADLLEQLMVDGVEALGSSDSAKLMAVMKEVLGKENRIQPYAPLTRDQGGKYWLQVGSGKGSEFYIRSSRTERNRLAKAVAKERGISLEQLKADGELAMGNDINDLRKRVLDSSDALRKLYVMIDDADFTAEEQGASLQKAKDGMKDSAFQLWLHMQPENSARKQFVHRSKTPPAGFETDVIKALANSIVKFSNHAARMKYTPLIRRSIAQAKSSIAEREEYTPYVAEMAKRMDDSLSPQKQDFWHGAAQFLNATSFGFFLTESTAFMQLLGTYQMGVPQLLKKHSVADVTREMGGMMAVWKTTGKYDKDGSWMMRTISEAADLQDLPSDSAEEKQRKYFEREAVDAMHKSNVAESTAARNVLNLKDVPTDQHGTFTQQAKRFMPMYIVSSLIHAAERLSREITYMASFRLNRDAALKKFHESATYKGAKNKLAAEREFLENNLDKFVTTAADDVDKAFFSYSEGNKPRYMRNVMGKLALTFFTFQLNAASFLVRNLIGMMKPLPGETRKECFRTFTALMGTTWSLSGVSGMFGMPAIVAFVYALMKAKAGDDEPDELKDMDPMEAFKVWLYEQLGDVTIGGVSLAQAIDKGPITAFSGIDVASRTGMSNILMPPELRESRSTREGVLNYAQWVGGANLQMILTMSDGADLLVDGEYERGLEKLVPWATVRNKMVAFRHWREGEESIKVGDEIMSAEMFKTGELLAEMVGLRPVLLTDVAAANRKATAMVAHVTDARKDILAKIERADRKGELERGIDARELKDKFNDKYRSLFPNMVISNEDVFDYKQAKADQRRRSWGGFEFNKNNKVMAEQVTERSRAALLKRELESIPRVEIKGVGKKE